MKIQLCIICLEAFKKKYNHTGVKITILELTIAPHSDECAKGIESLTAKAQGNIN